MTNDKNLRTYIVAFRYTTNDPELDPSKFDFHSLLDIGPGEFISNVASYKVSTTEEDRVAFEADQMNLWSD
jgi:hypothetical protein